MRPGLFTSTSALLCFVCSAIASEQWKAGIWLEQTSPQLTSPPATIVSTLKDAGFKAVLLSAADLTNSDVVDARKLQLLVMEGRNSYPAAGLGVLDAYLQHGGSYLTLGAEPFNNPLFPVDGQWVSLVAGVRGSTRVPETAWDLKNHGLGEPLRMTEDAGARRFRFEAGEVKSSMYAGFRPGALPKSGAIVCFEARGDKSTPLLCLELQETNGSRWKQIVKLTPAWQKFRVHSGSFLSYATPARTNDYFRGEKARMLYFGFINAMTGPGAHAFELRDIKFEEAMVSSKEAFQAQVPLPGGDLVRKYFGKHVAPPPARDWPGCFSAGESFKDARVSPVSGHALTRDLRGNPSASTASGRLLERNSAVRLDSSGDPILLFPEGPGAPRIIPLLAASDKEGAELGSVAALVIHRSGKYARGRWAVFGLDSFDQVPRELFARVARYVASGLIAEPFGPSFGHRDGVATVSLSQTVWNGSSERHQVACKSTLVQGGGTAITLEKVAEPKGFGSITTEVFGSPLDQFNWCNYRVDSDVLVDKALADRFTYTVDTRSALKDLCDFLVARAATNNAKFSGTHYFVDHRGARTLLAAYEIFGDERYRDAATAWAKRMVTEQRTDGGYRMGYGLGTRGESCFVADGGEIGLGVARAACYATGTDRQLLLDSVRAYMGYRDSFRCPGGGIGVGWSTTDFGKRPTIRLDRTEKIFAPELNTYTIGCTLGAAYVWATLTGREEDFKSARADADWFLARAKSASGATAESFVLAHALESDPAQRERYAAFLRRHFIGPISSSSNAWWLLRGGRASLDGHAMSYCRQRLGADPNLELQMARETSAMWAKESPTSIYRLFGKPKLNHDEWIYLCFGGLSLAETVEPMVTFRKLPLVK